MPTPTDDIHATRTSIEPTLITERPWTSESGAIMDPQVISGNTAIDMAFEQEKNMYVNETDARDQRDREEKVSQQEEHQTHRPNSDEKLEKQSSATLSDNSGPEELNQRHNSVVDANVWTETPAGHVSIQEELSPPPISSSPDLLPDNRDASPNSSLPTVSTSAINDNSPSPWTFSNVRLTPSALYHSSYLRPGSVFKGRQKSEARTYDVTVSIKHVSIPQSFLCGYLQIQGLTESNTSLTTYFEGEMIGNKYTFKTQNPSWGATEKDDQRHWDQFPAFKPLKQEAKKNSFVLKNWWNRESIFMRWKELILVSPQNPDELNGASYEGFYYICFDQVKGHIAGIYFHAKSEA
ncbi:MAG: hypothetical protein Q9227_006002 [Pyrenula ochraceoflavens]